MLLQLREYSYRFVFSCIIVIGFSQAFTYAKPKQDKTRDWRTSRFESYESVMQSGLIGEVLVKVISRGGRSKRYTDLIPLDGGTVGIAHFAVGGLAMLYREMDTEKYFARSKKEMIDKYSFACRPSGKSGNDTGWGCYSKDWWRKGMADFLSSPDSKTVQDAAWGSMMKPVLEKAISKRWTSARQIAIALGIANSLGAGGFETLAARRQWDAEATLRAYVGSNPHRQRREQAINENFPK